MKRPSFAVSSVTLDLTSDVKVKDRCLLKQKLLIFY
jgi:hypothetical protein